MATRERRPGAVAGGYFSFTHITEPGVHQAYNRWHQLDHLPEQLPLPGVVAGWRWVSTPACLRARVGPGGDLDDAQYLTLYLLAEPVERSLAEFLALARSLRTRGRFFSARRSLLSGPLTVGGRWADPSISISPDAVPFRPNLGVYVLVERFPTGGVAAATAPAGGPSIDAALTGTDGVVGAWTFSPGPLGPRLGGDGSEGRHEGHGAPRGGGERDGPVLITVLFLERPPVEVAVELAPVVQGLAAGGRAFLLAGPFETITPWRWTWFDEPVGHGGDRPRAGG